MIEAVANVRGIDIYLSSGIKKLSEQKQSFVAIHEQDRVDTIAENLIMRLEEVEVHNERYEMFVTAAEADLKHRYVEAGIDEGLIVFPRVFFVPEEYKLELGASSERTCATFKEIGNVCIIYVGDRADLKVASNIHHELHHAIGRKSFAIVGREVEGEMNIKVRTAQMGHKVAGNLFEEGVVDYYSTLFALESNDPAIVSARNIYSGGSLGGSEKYQKAVDVVVELVDKTNELFGEEWGAEMERLILAARIEPIAKSRLVRLINYLYCGDNRVAKYLFRSRLSVEDGENILAWMRQEGGKIPHGRKIV